MEGMHCYYDNFHSCWGHADQTKKIQKLLPSQILGSDFNILVLCLFAGNKKTICQACGGGGDE